MPPFGLALALLLTLASPATSCTKQEKAVLLRFLARLSQDGGLSASWRSSKNCCTWDGVTCNANGAVSEISLGSRGLEGTISPSLGDLGSLLRLNLSRNSFTSGLPVKLMSSGSVVALDVSFNSLGGQLQELSLSVSDLPMQVLNISSNLFTGEFPSTTWEKMKNLVTLNASNNSFTGQIPSSFCISSPSFAVLDLGYNQFSGEIPIGLGKCSSLRVLKAGQNNLSGTLPHELFNATSLEHLSFHKNALEGKIDGEHVIKLCNLVILDLGGNNMSGRIPASIGQLIRLEELHLNRNNMSGVLPSAIGNCTNLRIINLKSNNFGGELQQVNFSALQNLRILDLLSNEFTGEIPESIYSCNNLAALRLSANKFTGQLSPRIGNLKSLSFLSIAYNALENITNTIHVLKNSRNLTALLMGTNFMNEVMPDDETIDGFENLQILTIDGCQLSGKLSLWLSKLANLRILDLSNNQLSGPIPLWISSLNFLYYLDMSNNSLIGEIPIALMEMPMLQSDKIPAYLNQRISDLPIYIGASCGYRMLGAFPTNLNLGNNNLMGAIPSEIGQLKVLFKLNLSFNKLQGGIPESICDLTSLQVLDLSNNNLIGEIPRELNKLHFLSMLNISNNDLEGLLPTEGQFTTFPSSSFDGNPKLCGPMLNQHCNSAKAPKVSVLSKEQTYKKAVFMIAFGAFFAVGVLYDQIVLSRYFS